MVSYSLNGGAAALRLMANKQSDRQLIASKFPEASRLFGLTFSLGKTEVLFQPASGYTALRPGDQPGKDPSLFFNLLLAPPLFGLTLSLGKTGVLFQPASSSAALLNSITVDRTELKTVDDFKELGSALSKGWLPRQGNHLRNLHITQPYPSAS